MDEVSSANPDVRDIRKKQTKNFDAIKDPKSKWLILINMYPFPHANSLVHLLDFKIVPYALQLRQTKT